MRVTVQKNITGRRANAFRIGDTCFMVSDEKVRVWQGTLDTLPIGAVTMSRFEFRAIAHWFQGFERVEAGHDPRPLEQRV